MKLSRLNIISLLVLFTGILTLSSTLFAVAHLHRVRLVLSDAHVVVIAGISLIYLATLLKRGKRNAWMVAIGVYVYLIARNIEHFIIDGYKNERILPVVLNLLIPSVTLIGLIAYRHLYVVKSEPRSFEIALKRSLLVLAVALIYGIVGFELLDRVDFGQEISVIGALHNTVDQLGLTTQQELVAHTIRGRFFVDSLAAVSLTAIAYTAISFFAPIKFKLSSHDNDLILAFNLAKKYSRTSEDFFKFWPRDKEYFFDSSRTAFIAYRVVRGVALVVGDPVVPADKIKKILTEFSEYCRLNDWVISFIHADDKSFKLYKSHGFSGQKIGEEALLDISKFVDSTVSNKYFRHINNKFTKLGYTTELLTPPFSAEILAQIRTISTDWLEQPGRSERGFMMGFFSLEYINQCQLMVVYDESKKVAAFMNQVPTIVPGEANYDFLRHTSSSPGNINDFLMINFVKSLAEDGYKKLNMGLCPLAGLETDSEDRTIIDGLLNFVYSNAGRFYSFQGLRRFKSKYEPEWEPRYIYYKGGLPGLTRTSNSLLKAMTHYNLRDKPLPGMFYERNYDTMEPENAKIKS